MEGITATVEGEDECPTELQALRRFRGALYILKRDVVLVGPS